jgi:uridine kinase
MLIGIGGASNSGKSWLAKKLKDHLYDRDVIILCQDDYAYPKEIIPLINQHINWEIPESINFEKFKNDIIKVKSSHTIVIIEGLMIFHHHEINQLIDKRIFIELEKEEFFKRKSTDLRWGKEEDWYIEHIWNSYLKYGIVDSNDKNILHLSSNFIDVNKALNFLF